MTLIRETTDRWQDDSREYVGLSVHPPIRDVPNSESQFWKRTELGIVESEGLEWQSFQKEGKEPPK